MLTLIILPLISFIGLYIIYSASSFSYGSRALIATGLSLFFIVFTGTESLSCFHLLNQTWITTYWIFCTIIICTIAVKKYSQIKLTLSEYKTPWFSIVIAISLIATLCVALGSASNTWDGMSYHMSRVVHWINNQSVEYYFTPIGRQNYMPPLNEEAILHLQLLTQSDYFSNIISWICFSLSLVTVSAIAAHLNLSRSLQWLSLTLASLVPMAIFQATGCKNDSALAFLFLSFVYFLLRISTTHTFQETILAGLSLGLGIYCKTTFIILGGSFVLWYIVIFAYQQQTNQINKKLIKSLIVILVLGILISSPYWIREAKSEFKGTHLEAQIQNNQDKSPEGIAANIIRSIAVQLPLPIAKWNHTLYNSVKWILGIHLNDTKTTYPGYQYLSYYWAHEDHMGNFMPFLLILCAYLILTFNFKKLSKNEMLLYTTPITAFIVFAILLKWQPWINRLYTPLFLLSSVLICCAINQIILKYNSFINNLIIPTLVLLSLICALPALFYNSSRPIISIDGYGIFQIDRISQYFVNRPELKSDYLAVDRILKNSNLGNISVGLLLGPDDWEYPILVLSGATTGSRHAAYKLHNIEANKPERVILALGSMSQVLNNQPQLKIIYQGNYAGLYEVK